MAEEITNEMVVKNATWLRSYAKKKPIKNFGGNFWGINRNRCTIMQPEMINKLVDGGFATRQGNQIVMIA